MRITKSLLIAIAAIARPSAAFVPAKHQNAVHRAFVTNTKPTEMRATAPTMFIYWSIKTAMDTIEYAMGKRDEVKGTGMLSFIEFKRESKDEEEDEE